MTKHSFQNSYFTCPLSTVKFKTVFSHIQHTDLLHIFITDDDISNQL